MRNRSVVLVALLAVASAMPAAAQRNSVGLSYDVSFPMGDLKDYTNNDSWLGATLDFRSSNGKNLTLGGSLGYYEFYESIGSGNPINFPQGAIQGQQYRHLFSIPILLSANLFLGDGLARARPFIGLSGGISYQKQDLDIGIYTMQTDAWVMTAMPEAGVMITTSRRTQMNLHVRYFYPFSSDNLCSAQGCGSSFQQLSVGLGFMGRLF